MSSSDNTSHTQAETFLVAEDGTEHALQSPCEIGRSENCLITLEDTQVSRTHTLIQRDSNGTWWLTDLESTNGTYVNHHRVNQATKLANDDSVAIGTIAFTFKDTHEKKSDIEHDEGPSGTNIIFSQTHCWLLVADIVDSTTHTQTLAPQELNIKISDWATKCEKIINDNNGAINQYLGDGFFAFWNGRASDGKQMLATLQELNNLRPQHELEFRIVLHFGPVQIGGLLNRGEENLTGSAVHYIFKAEKVAGSLGEKIFITDNAAKEINASQLKLIGSYTVPGFPNESEFYTLQD